MQHEIVVTCVYVIGLGDNDGHTLLREIHDHFRRASGGSNLGHQRVEGLFQISITLVEGRARFIHVLAMPSAHPGPS